MYVYIFGEFMRINDDANLNLRRALGFVMEIKQIFSNSPSPAPFEQNALIFCLKAVGICIDEAAKRMGLDFSKPLTYHQHLPRDTVLFLRNMHYLRNALIHHFDSNMLNGFVLSADENALLFKLCKNIGQVEFYLNLITTQKKTDIDLGRQRFKVFFDFHDLSQQFMKDSPREARAGRTQAQYLQAMADALSILKNLIIKGREINVELIDRLRRSEPHNYFAMQNLLECVTVLGNPNPFGDGSQLISNASRAAIFSIDGHADDYLRNLATNRIVAVHDKASAVIPDAELVDNLREMMLLHQILLDPAVEKTSVGKRLESKYERTTPSAVKEEGEKEEEAQPQDKDRNNDPSKGGGSAPPTPSMFGRK